MKIGLDRRDLYTDSSLAFKFEFKSPVRRRDMASKLANNTGKKVKWFKGIDESFKPSSEIFKLSDKYSHSSKTFIFETGLLPYSDAMRLMLQTMNLIEHFGHTDDRCEMKVDISLNDRKLGLPFGISKLNKFKYLVGLDEDAILESWNTEETERKKINLADLNKGFELYLKNDDVKNRKENETFQKSLQYIYV